MPGVGGCDDALLRWPASDYDRPGRALSDERGNLLLQPAACLERSDLLDVHALPLPGLAGADGFLPAAGGLFVLPARMFLLRVVLRLHLFMRLLHLPFDEHRPVVPLLD